MIPYKELKHTSEVSSPGTASSSLNVELLVAVVALLVGRLLVVGEAVADISVHV
jgi:hypothetical protein